MIYKEFQPSPILSEYIKCFWVLRQSETPFSPTPDPILPDGSPEMVFNLSSPFRRFHENSIEMQPQSIVVGQMKSFVLIEPAKEINLFGVRFNPFGLYPFLNQSIHEITGRIEKIDTVFNRTGNELEEKINESRTVKERIINFENTFAKILLRKSSKENLVKLATKKIIDCMGQITIRNLVRELDTNFKQIERDFKRQIGLTPKGFARITRLQKLTQYISQNNIKNWADVAYLFGYFDQSHLIKDFQNFSGNSPNLFLKKEKNLTDFFVQ